MAHTLFSVFLTAVLELVKQQMPEGMKLRYRMDDIFNLQKLKAKTKTRALTVTERQYADDNAILANSAEELQFAMNAFNAAYTQLGLKLNVKKTQILHQPRPGNNHPRHATITVNGQYLSNVETFTYLGSCLSAKANADAEIERPYF